MTLKIKHLLFGSGSAAAAVAAGALLLSSTGASAAVTGCAPIAESLFSAVIPANSTSTDHNAVNLGVHFSSAVAGQVNAVRFYKGSGNTGTHVGSLWTSTGTRLEKVTFGNESASGWQTVYFFWPVTIQANTDYVVSYLAPAGGYAYTPAFPLPFSNSDLTATAFGYSYSGSAVFPATGSAANYLVDLVFTPNGSTPTISPSASAPSSPSPSASASDSSSPSASASPSSTGTLPAGVTLVQADGGPGYYSKWSNTFPSTDAFLPIGVYPSESLPSSLTAEGINFFTPARNDNNGTWCPTWSNPNGNDMAHVDAQAGFYAGGTFYNTINSQPWGAGAAFDVFGDELDGNAGNWFDCLPGNIMNNNTPGSWGGLSAGSFTAAESASKSDDPTRPTYVQTTTTFIDGGHNYFYTTAQKQAICAGADIFSFDIYPLVLRGGHVWDMYDQVREARGYCQDARPVMAFAEMDHMDNGSVYPLPAQTAAEVWNAIIAGAHGVQYFDQYGNIDDQTYTGAGHYAAGAMYNAIKSTNAEIDSLAPVINAPFANGYVTPTGTMSVMAKYSGGSFYVFAIPHASGSQTVTFTLAGAPNTTVTVVGENRSVTVTNGTFIDTFANENTVHIYKIP